MLDSMANWGNIQVDVRGSNPQVVRKDGSLARGGILRPGVHFLFQA